MDPRSEVRGGGAQLKKSPRPERSAKNYGVLVFRVKNHDFTHKNIIFSNLCVPSLHPQAAPVRNNILFYSVL